MLAVISFLIVLSVLILIHEAGHYFAARLFKIKADEFGYGLPPRIIGVVKENGKWKRVKSRDQQSYKNTIWSINWLPIGGFVRIKGEQGDTPDDPDAFHTKPIWQRFIVIAAGVIMNWVLAAVLLSIGLMIGIPAMLGDEPAGAIVTNHEVSIVETLKDGIADKAGIEAMDAIVRVGEVTPMNVEDVQKAIESHGEESFDILVRRGEEEITVTVTPKYLEEIGKPGIGVSLMDTGTVRFPPHLAIVHGIGLTWDYTVMMIQTFGDLFKDLFTGGGETVDQVSGPIGIAVFTGKVAEQGILQLIQFSAILSINLAVLNFLPFPALDGGRAIFLILEAIRRKPVKRDVEAVIHNIAFLILIGLVILVSIRDIGRFF